MGVVLPGLLPCFSAKAGKKVMQRRKKSNCCLLGMCRVESGNMEEMVPPLFPPLSPARSHPCGFTQASSSSPASGCLAWTANELKNDSRTQPELLGKVMYS